MLDLLIVGAGPAGLATALHADRAGLACALVDRRTPPYDKACGEGLMPDAVAVLERLGVQIRGQEFAGIRYLSGDRRVTARFIGRPGMGVRRTVLHAAMARAVHARGIEIHRHAVGAIEQHPDRVIAAGLSARYLVGADGLHSTVRRLAGLDGSLVARRKRRWGQRCHVRTAPWTDVVEVYWASSARAEAYVTPVGPDTVGVAVLGPRRASFAEHLAAFPDLAARLDGAPRDTVLGAGPLRQRASGRRAGRVLLVGDAAGYVDALTGEGIGVALRGARALVECLAGDRPEGYEAAWRTTSRRYRLLTAALVGAANRPALHAAVVPVAARLPGLFGGAVEMLTGGEVIAVDGRRPRSSPAAPAPRA